MGETSEEQLGALIDQQRESGVRLAIFGFGRAEAIDARLAALAARARGGSGYVNTRADAELALAQQLDSLFAPAAERVELAVEFDPAQVARARAIDEAELRAVGGGASWRVARRARVLPGETLTGLFEVEPVRGRQPDAQAVRVRLQADAVAPTPGGAARRWERAWVGALSDRPLAEGRVDFRFAAAVGAFGEVLRAGPAAAGKLDDIEHWAAGALGTDVGGYRAELLAMIAQFRRMDGR